MKNFLAKYGPTVLAVGGAVLTAATPEIRAVIASHPKVASVLGGAVATVLHWLPSPAQPSNQ